jgi:twitching motility protein PilT
MLPSSIFSLEQLNLPETLHRFAEYSKGLVVVTGPPGSGKSSTLAALIDYINRTQQRHVLTIEDPIEYVHEDKSCMINQREVGRHTRSFASALRASLREDPNIILVGEMRDLETISLAITAAETGQLVFGTLHTASAPQTVSRLIDVFPGDRQDQIRTMLAESLQGVVAQRLLRRADGQGRVPALEILIGTPAVRTLIRDAKLFQVPSVMQTGRREGMVLMDDYLQQLVKTGVVSSDEARLHASRKEIFREGGHTAGDGASDDRRKAA